MAFYDVASACQTRTTACLCSCGCITTGGRAIEPGLPIAPSNSPANLESWGVEVLQGLYYLPAKLAIPQCRNHAVLRPSLQISRRYGAGSIADLLLNTALSPTDACAAKTACCHATQAPLSLVLLSCQSPETGRAAAAAAPAAAAPPPPPPPRAARVSPRP